MKKISNENEHLINAIYYKEKFRLDFIPLKINKSGKRPLVNSWKELQNNEQTIEDLKKYEWDKANGLGMINKTITTLDFDKCIDEKFVRTIIKELGDNYWLIKTGFGFHLHFVLDEPELLEIILGSKGVHTFKPKDKNILKQAELRVKGCYTTFPRSKHFNGNYYEFVDGEPEYLPDKISSKKLIEILKRYFILFEKNGKEPDQLQDEFYTAFSKGVEKGERHNTLIKMFGILYSGGMRKSFIITILTDWNKKNKPPYSEKEMIKQLNDLFGRYDKGLDGEFLEFNGCLLQLQDEDDFKLKKIICYAVVEYGGDKKIIKELKIGNKLKEYHKECKKLVEHYEKWTAKKDQIVRVGKTLLLDTLNKKFSFDYFCIYVGILSYLGRNKLKPAKKISYSIIQYRAMGYKNENEYLRSKSDVKTYSKHKVKRAIEFLEKANFIRTFCLVKGQMIWFSTFFASYEKLAEWVKNYEMKKLNKKKDKEEIRLRVLVEIRNAESELKDLSKKKKIIDPSSSSLHLLSNEN